MLCRIGVAAALAAACACPATASDAGWASSQIREVTQLGALGSSPASFAPQAPLTQAALAQALAATAALQHPAAPAATTAPADPVEVLATIGQGAVVAGIVPLEVQAPGRTVGQVAFAIDGTGTSTTSEAPYVFWLDTTRLADGPHQLAVNVAFQGGGFAIATWSVTVSNAPGSPLTTAGDPVSVPVAKSSLPAATPAAASAVTLYRAISPARSVTVKQLDAALVAYLGLGDAARAIQATLRGAGLAPPANTGTEAVARLLGLRVNHPAADDSLELLPGQPATRAEAAYSLAQVLHTDQTAIDAVRQAATAFALPALGSWQQQVLARAVSYVGFPYVWGGTSPAAQTLFGARVPGGFDCSGFIWRVYKLTAYAGAPELASVLRGRTTYEMSAEVPRSDRVAAADLQPGDVMFFGARGPKSKPSQVDHAALYLGDGWLIQSSDHGVTLVPFDGWYRTRFAWGRRPLREAGLESS